MPTTFTTLVVICTMLAVHLAEVVVPRKALGASVECGVFYSSSGFRTNPASWKEGTRDAIVDLEGLFALLVHTFLTCIAIDISAAFKKYSTTRAINESTVSRSYRLGLRGAVTCIAIGIAAFQKFSSTTRAIDEATVSRSYRLGLCDSAFAFGRASAGGLGPLCL